MVDARFFLRFAFGLLAYLALFLALLMLLPIAPTAAAAPLPPNSLLSLLIAHGHLGVIVVGNGLIQASAGSFTGRKDAQPRSPTAQRAWQQLLSGIGSLTVAWMFLYMTLWNTWSDSLPLLGGWLHGPRGLAIADAWNTLASLSFFYLYLVLDQPSVRSEDDAERGAGFRRAPSPCSRSSDASAGSGSSGSGPSPGRCSGRCR